MKARFPVLVFLLGIMLISFSNAATSIGSLGASIGRVTVNNAVVIETRNNLVTDSTSILGPNSFLVAAEVIFQNDVNDARIEAILRGRQTGMTVSDSTVTFNYAAGERILQFFNIFLSDGMLNDREFELTIRVLDLNGNSETMIYPLVISNVVFPTSAASRFDVSIDRVSANGQVLAESRTNIMNDSNTMDILVAFTSLENSENVHVEASLRDLRTGNTVADSTFAFDILDDVNYNVPLSLTLIDPLDDADLFELIVKVVSEQGRYEQKAYRIRNDDGTLSSLNGNFDVSIDRVLVNSKVVASSSTNFLDETNDFDVLAEFTALDDLEDAHVEAILKDRRTGLVVADSTSNFDLAEDSSSSRLLALELIEDLKDSDTFDLTIKIVDSEGHSTQKIYGIKMDGRSTSGVAGNLDISLDRVELEGSVLTEGDMSFVFIGASRKLDLDVSLTSLEDTENARIEAVLMLENGDVVADVTNTFDLADDGQLRRSLDLELPHDFEQGIFKLKVKVIDAEGQYIENYYDVKLSKSRLPVLIQSIMLSPENEAGSGKQMVAVMRIQNIGTSTLKGVLAQISIPELGVATSKLVGELDSREEAFVELAIKIPQNALAGQYTLHSEVAQQFSSEKEIKDIQFTVVETAAPNTLDRLVITLPVVEQRVYGDKESVYPIIMKNEGTSAMTYTMLISGAEWANVRLSDSNVFILKPQETKTMELFVSSKGDVSGKQDITVTVKNKEKELRQLELVANVAAPRGINWKHVLMVTMMAIVILLVLAGAYFGANAYNEDKAEEPSKADNGYAESYY